MAQPANLNNVDATYEDEHVHKVYDAIAPHFSHTRSRVSHAFSRLIHSWLLAMATRC